MTALYIVLVPILGIFLGRKIGKQIWFAVLLAVIGLYFLCVKGELRLETGDIYLLLCALTFAMQILSIDHYTREVDGIILSCTEFTVTAALSFICMLLFEHPRFADLKPAAFSIFYTGVMSSGVAYTLQILGQKELEPALASLIMSLEAVISALAGWALLHQTLTARELVGCGIMFAAILVAQLPEKNHTHEETA